jgi:putative nucleotidyltransferase with HDIG domain
VGGQPFPICILPDNERRDDMRMGKVVKIAGVGMVEALRTFTLKSPELRDIVSYAAQQEFLLSLQPAIVDFTLANLQPTDKLDDSATTEARARAKEEVSPNEARVDYAADQPLVYKSVDHPLDQQGWQLLRAEHQAYIKSLKHYRWMARVGVAGIVLAIVGALGAYIVFYQPRILRNHTRQVAIAALMLSMLLLNQIAAIGSGPLYLFGVAPTLLVAMILTIAYDQRTAMTIATMHALLATVALNQGVTFFVVIWVGVLTICFMLNDIRTRSKLIEVGGITALSMAAATAAAGLLAFDPLIAIQQNCLYAGAAGLAVGFVVLGILPFIEKAFKITTSMTLLEQADVSQPLLRRLAVEAPGTYNHSLQVATIAEAAAEAIKANSLLCRVASYYHDSGKINKADYFCENQGAGENRHLNLSPNVSLLVIIGHVKDGIELAHEYNLPHAIIPFIQQHHGTTLVEFFYHQAVTQQEQRQPDMPAVSDTQYRYPGPKPKTKEIAIVMLADAVESAARAVMVEPTASRVEGLVHELAMKRLLDGQFDDCDLTMRELELIERSMMKTLMSIYHGRIAYPSTAGMSASAEALAIKSA